VNHAHLSQVSGLPSAIGRLALNRFAMMDSALTETMGIESLGETRSDNFIHASILEDSQLQEFLAQGTMT
jgi:hypothetical protein